MSILSSFVGWLGWLSPRDEKGTQTPIPLYPPAAPATTVTFDAAMQVSAFWACARLISETVAGLPIKFYRKDDGAEVTNRALPLLTLLRGRVNRYQTLVEFLETMLLNLCTHGNAYARIVRGANDEIVALLPMMSGQMEVRILDDGSRTFIYTTTQATVAYAESSIWHIRLFGNGYIGLSPLGHARNSLGIAIASEKRVSQVFENGAKPAGILMYDKVLTPTQRANIRQSFKDLVEGNNDSLLVLEAGMKYETISMTPQDIELLASRRFQIEDICRFMGVPSVLVNDTASSTTWGSGIEQIISGWYKLGLKPYLTRIEQSIVINLLSERERELYEVEFDFDALLRADPAARFAGYQSAINAGVMTPNEAREREGLDSVEGADTLLVNSTMVPIDRVGASSVVVPESREEIAEKIASAMQAEAMQRELRELRQQVKSLEQRKSSLRVVRDVLRDQTGRVSQIIDQEG